MPCFSLLIHFFCSGKVIVHALDEKARAYYNLEGLWTPGTLQNEPIEVNMRPTYYSKKIRFCSHL